MLELHVHLVKVDDGATAGREAAVRVEHDAVGVEPGVERGSDAGLDGVHRVDVLRVDAHAAEADLEVGPQLP